MELISKIIEIVIEIDNNIHQAILKMHRPWLTKSMTILTHLGSSTVWYILYAIFFIFIKSGMDITLLTNGMGGLLLVLLFAELFGLLIIICLRHLTKRERPSKDLAVRIMDPWNRYSFPSLHSTRAFMIATVIGVACPEWWGYMMSIAIMTGFSRLYLEKHYLSDVLTGAFVGICSALISLSFFNSF
ncbi:MAG: phosphatase PAP2 family protein [Desulfamplus sp.]|nr:phosphatase PAP2 family protein [Desulfamplus sp.]